MRWNDKARLTRDGATDSTVVGREEQRPWPQDTEARAPGGVKARARAFTFIEVMIVVVIIGLLAGAVTLSTRHYLDRAKGNRAKTDIATFRSAIETFYGEEGRYPTTDEGIEALVPEYIDQLRQDPWGRPYQYVQPGRTAPYEIICYGADGRAGGEGADADIGSAAAEGLSD